MGLEPNDIYLLDIRGKTIYLNDMSEVSPELKYFIFNKTFQKEQLMKIIEENIDKTISGVGISTNFIQPSNSNPPSLPDFNFTYPIIEQNAKMIEKCGITPNDIKVTYEQISLAYESAKTICKTVKTNLKLCDKIKDNFGYQYNSLECIYKNISFLYE
jgi:hypothetical protein